MLEHFRVPEEDEIRIKPDDLRRTVDAIFQKLGLNPGDSALATD